MINWKLWGCVVFLGSSGLLACSSAPKVSSQAVSETEAKAWFQKYCSSGNRNLTGDLVVKSNTQEFKGQFPAGVHVDPDGSFKLEVTNIIGGTLLRISGHDRSMRIEVPSKPKLNQTSATHYLGLDVPILTELLLGDLPCPNEKDRVGIRVQKNQMIIQTPLWNWTFEKSEDESGSVPVRILLTEVGKSGSQARQIVLQIEEWDVNQSFAKKVSVKSPEGDLKWTWRSRN